MPTSASAISATLPPPGRFDAEKLRDAKLIAHETGRQPDAVALEAGNLRAKAGFGVPARFLITPDWAGREWLPGKAPAAVAGSWERNGP
jgi:hypothetical protein